MKVQTTCPQPECGSTFAFDYAPGQSAALCPGCRHEISLDTEATHAGRMLSRCPCCRCDEFFLRKDFPQKLGLLIVIGAALFSLILFARGRLLGSLAILLAVVIVDMVIYALVPKITVCYRCRSTFRGFPLNTHHKGFDLATAEKYRGFEMQ